MHSIGADSGFDSVLEYDLLRKLQLDAIGSLLKLFYLEGLDDDGFFSSQFLIFALSLVTVTNLTFEFIKDPENI